MDYKDIYCGTLGGVPKKMLPELVDAWAQQHPQGLRIFPTPLDCHLQLAKSSGGKMFLAPPQQT